MGDTRHVHARLAAALVMVATGLLGVVSASPAAAAGPYPDSCVQTRSGETVRFESGVPLDDLYLVNGREFQSGQRWLLTDQFNRLGSVASVTFDNQAQLGYDDPPPNGGEVRVRPKQALPASWGSGDYTFHVDSGPVMPSHTIVVTIRWSDCDEDDDFRGDKTNDNCVGLHNPDQSDRDRDGKGDPCDPDDDNDGVADTGDNCPAVANRDQTDWDADRIGNACDSTPGTAPTAPTTPTTPPGTSSGYTSGCAYVRTIGLRHKTARHRFVGKVESVAVGCRAGVEVTLWRKRSGADRKLVVVTSRPTGTFRTRAPRRAGRYYASVGSPTQPLCGDATSRVVRVRQR